MIESVKLQRQSIRDTIVELFPEARDRGLEFDVGDVRIAFSDGNRSTSVPHRHLIYKLVLLSLGYGKNKSRVIITPDETWKTLLMQRVRGLQQIADREKRYQEQELLARKRLAEKTADKQHALLAMLTDAGTAVDARVTSMVVDQPLVIEWQECSVKQMAWLLSAVSLIDGVQEE